jgi:hypothetical protein
MPNASPRDTQAGWEIFFSHDGEIGLEDLNRELANGGFRPISNRTIRHYHNLLNAGYTRYISINRFDVARAAEPYESPSAKGRYNYRPVDIEVDVIFAKSSTFLEAAGRATEVGDVGAVSISTARTPSRGLSRFVPPVARWS